MLTIIQVGHDDASDRYIRNKTRAIEQAGLEAKVVNLFARCTTDDVLSAIVAAMNSTAIMVQLPLPDHINKSLVLSSIPPEKDIDGLNPHSDYTPLTPSAIMRWFNERSYDLAGKHVAIFGRSELVGKPLANLMIDAGVTVSVLNSMTTPEVAEVMCGSANVIVSAVGKPNVIQPLHVIQGPIKDVVIDVGINRDVNGSLCGDVSVDARKHVNDCGGYCSPVPGGVGKWTVRELVLRLKEMEESRAYTENATETEQNDEESPVMPEETPVINTECPEETEVIRITRNKHYRPVLYVNGERVYYGSSFMIDGNIDGALTYDVMGVSV